MSETRARIVVVTGATRGIGRALVDRLAEQYLCPASIAIGAPPHELLTDVEGELRTRGAIGGKVERFAWIVVSAVVGALAYLVKGS